MRSGATGAPMSRSGSRRRPGADGGRENPAMAYNDVASRSHSEVPHALGCVVVGTPTRPDALLPLLTLLNAPSRVSPVSSGGRTLRASVKSTCARKPKCPARGGPTPRLQRSPQALSRSGQVQGHDTLFAAERLSPLAREPYRSSVSPTPGGTTFFPDRYRYGAAPMALRKECTPRDPGPVCRGFQGYGKMEGGAR
jgi:hypothetical protein